MAFSKVALEKRTQVRLGEIQNFVTSAVEHRLDQVNSEAFGLRQSLRPSRTGLSAGNTAAFPISDELRLRFVTKPASVASMPVGLP